jgi:peptidoglycan/xylan/chitin deacetylase (PgdA/CDA1 family)
MTATATISTSLRFPALVLLSGLAGAACSSAGGAGDDDDDDDGLDGGIRPPDPDASIGECAPAAAGGFTFEKIATWLDDATAAYSMIHDDMCGPALQGIHELAVPALDDYGLTAGLAPFVEACEENGLWSVVVDAEAKGNEIVSHSYTHPEITASNAAHEITEAKAAFEEYTANPITFYIFPYDYFTPATIAAVGAAGHFGARAGNRDDNDGFDMPPINTAEPVNDLEVEFDVWPRNYSKYALFFPEEILLVHAHNAIERGGWALREFHSVIADGSSETGQGFGPITETAYRRHLEFLASARKKGVLWTGTPSTVLKYRHARTACGADVAGETITYDTSNPDCAKYATPISVIVTTAEDLPRIDGVQGGATVKTRKLGPNRFSVTADPTAGPVTLSGCSNPGYENDPDLAITPKPTPAASVCLIETVAGTGSPGLMDDLERPAEEFQVLPNPTQGDGRTGTWSWYPQNAEVEMQADGSNTVLRYAGTNLDAWTGATLAFLGGNGAGSCYDGTAYEGIRFRIKGSVTSADELNGKVVVSVVTAKTQSRLYGGDMVGEGGHFHQVVTLTPDWTTVTIPWTGLLRPSWGTTMSLTAVAKEALQAIDWGVTIAASSFEIFIDDVEMY